MLADALYSQIAVHAEYGGVVPELASRDHSRKTLPLVDEVIKTAGLVKQDIDAVAYTYGPRLLGALIGGATMARARAAGLRVRARRVPKVQGHLDVQLRFADTAD